MGALPPLGAAGAGASAMVLLLLGFSIFCKNVRL